MWRRQWIISLQMSFKIDFQIMPNFHIGISKFGIKFGTMDPSQCRSIDQSRKPSEARISQHQWICINIDK